MNTVHCKALKDKQAPKHGSKLQFLTVPQTKTLRSPRRFEPGNTHPHSLQALFREADLSPAALSTCGQATAQYPGWRGAGGGGGPVQGSGNFATGADPRGQLSSSFTSLSISSRRDGPSIPAEVGRPVPPTPPLTQAKPGLQPQGQGSTAAQAAFGWAEDSRLGSLPRGAGWPPYVTWLGSWGRPKGTQTPRDPLPEGESRSNGPERSPLHCMESPSPSQCLPPGPQGAVLPPCDGVGAGKTCQQVPVIPPPPAPCTSLAFHPPSPPRGSSPRAVFSPTHPPSPRRKESTSLQTDGGGEHGRETEREPRLPRERTEPPVPGWEPKGSHRLADPWREGPGLQRPPPGQRGVPELREPPRGARVSGPGALRPRGGGSPRCPRPARPTQPGPAPPARALAPTEQKPRAEAAPPGPGPGCRRRARSAPLPPGRGAPPGAQARPGPGAAAAPAPPPLQRPPPPAPPRRGRRASLPQAVAGGGTGCISPGYIAAPGRRGGVGNAEPAELPAPDVRGGRRGREGGDRGGGGCGSGASHPLTFTSPAAFRALLPRLLAVRSPRGRPRPRSSGPDSIAAPGSPSRRCRSARGSRTQRAVM